MLCTPSQSLNVPYHHMYLACELQDIRPSIPFSLDNRTLVDGALSLLDLPPLLLHTTRDDSLADVRANYLRTPSALKC